MKTDQLTMRINEDLKRRFLHLCKSQGETLSGRITDHIKHDLMHEPINNVTRQIRSNLIEGDPVEQAIERSNVKKALEILALRIKRTQTEGR